jgi:hypothetical protein
MRRSELLKRIGGNAPCMFCHVPIDILRAAGKDDAAFLLPGLAQGIWEASGLEEATRIQLNQIFSELFRCSSEVDVKFLKCAELIRNEVLALANANEELRSLCAEFLDLMAP